MNEQLQRVWDNLANLGGRRLIALAVVGVSVFAIIAAGSYFMSRSEMETLYIGLTPQDTTRIGAALQEAGIAFDTDAEGAKVFVKRGQTVQARMVLAEKGLPMSATAGYELFDKLGSMSLTSFMQNITKVRALEGEIARTVQAMRGVKAARVHIVLPDPGSFRRAAQPPSASVVIRTDPGGQPPSAQAIRHLVASAIPGLGLEQVSVLSTDGTVLAAGGDAANGASLKTLELERSLAKELQDNIRKTLTPYLGYDNFEVSVSARLNVDKRSTNETVFDPENKAERSVRVVKESGASQNAGRNWTVSVEQNIPAEDKPSQQGEQSKRSNERREELTNFELPTKTVATLSEGYRIETLAIAVVVNRKRLAVIAGDGAAIDEQVKKVEQLAASASGYEVKRGDKMTVAAVDFFDAALAAEPDTGWGDAFSRHASMMVTALIVLAIAGMLIWFVLRPALKALAEGPPSPLLAAPGAPAAMLGVPASVTGAASVFPVQSPTAAAPLEAAFEEIQPAPSHIKRLEELVERSEDKAAAVLKLWINQ